MDRRRRCRETGGLTGERFLQGTACGNGIVCGLCSRNRRHCVCQRLVFEYSDEGVPTGLCEGKRLVYVTTAGGYIPEHDHGYSYVRDVFTDFFGFSDTMCIKAEGLDIVGMDVETLLRAAEQEIEEKV